MHEPEKKDRFKGYRHFINPLLTSPAPPLPRKRSTCVLHTVQHALTAYPCREASSTVSVPSLVCCCAPSARAVEIRAHNANFTGTQYRNVSALVGGGELVYEPCQNPRYSTVSVSGCEYSSWHSHIMTGVTGRDRDYSTLQIHTNFHDWCTNYSVRLDRHLCAPSQHQWRLAPSGFLHNTINPFGPGAGRAPVC